MAIVFFWLILSFVVGALGSERSTGFFGALILSLLLSPLIGFLIVIASARKSDNSQFEDDPNITAKMFKLNDRNLTGKIDVVALKSYCIKRSLPKDTTEDLLLVTRRVFDDTYSNAYIIDTLPPNQDGYIEFIYKRK